jgi:quercetin dioxygenase-like cupin family protein
MRITPKRLSCVAAAGILLAGAASFAMPDQSSADPQQRIVLSPPAGMPWKPGATPGIEQALLWGDRDHGANATMTRYPSGFELKPHYHTNNMQGVIVSGEWLLGIVGGRTERLPAGSYFFLPGHTAHTDRCDGPTPCVMFIAQDDLRDTVYLQPQER